MEGRERKYYCDACHPREGGRRHGGNRRTVNARHAGVEDNADRVGVNDVAVSASAAENNLCVSRDEKLSAPFSNNVEEKLKRTGSEISRRSTHRPQHRLIIDHLRQPKVCDLALRSSSFRQQEVLGLEVAVRDALRVEVRDGLTDHEGELASFGFLCEREEGRRGWADL